MDRISLRFDRQNCMGCHACEVACKQEHGLGVGPRLVRVIENGSDFLPVYCRHCARPPCREACPAGAISRNGQGVVLIDNERCLGCRECIWACPFGAMQFDDRLEVAVKCDLCIERLKKDKQTACMDICPTRCIHLGGKKNIAAVFERTIS